MQKYIDDWTVKESLTLNDHLCLLKLGLDNNSGEERIKQILPGQFVQVRVDDSPDTFLRRPISIHFVIPEKNEIWLLIQMVGSGTKTLAGMKAGDKLNIIYPLGNGFSGYPSKSSLNERLINEPLLVGGGVGIAPLLFLGAKLYADGYKPVFLLGAKTKQDLVQLAEFEKIGTVYTTTEDGSFGLKGFVTNHPVLQENNFCFIYTCGPKPMMMAVAKYAKQRSIPCEVSLENTMACGIGACLCCVEKTINGHICVCTEGPVININQLKWQI
jgi:dihydroorotate dehydrogenase electron transfer subunit